jgi:hypothetical protein
MASDSLEATLLLLETDILITGAENSSKVIFFTLFSYRYFPLILGKSIDDPAVKDFQQKFP